MPTTLHFQARWRSIKDTWVLLMLHFLCETLKQRGDLTVWEQEAFKTFHDGLEPAGFGLIPVPLDELIRDENCRSRMIELLLDTRDLLYVRFPTTIPKDWLNSLTFLDAEFRVNPPTSLLDNFAITPTINLIRSPSPMNPNLPPLSGYDDSVVDR